MLLAVALKNFPELDKSSDINFKAYVFSFRVLTTSLLGLANRVPRVEEAKVFV